MSRRPSSEGGGIPPAPAAVKGRETILLVDDERRVLNFTARVLEKEGYRVLTAGDGEEALALCQEFTGPIHLLITDVMMPVMNGRELAERLCALRPEIRVLFISGYGRPAREADDLCEEVDWLPKPFTVPKLYRKVRALLDGPAVAS